MREREAQRDRRRRRERWRGRQGGGAWGERGRKRRNRKRGQTEEREGGRERDIQAFSECTCQAPLGLKRVSRVAMCWHKGAKHFCVPAFVAHSPLR